MNTVSFTNATFFEWQQRWKTILHLQKYDRIFKMTIKWGTGVMTCNILNSHLNYLLLRLFHKVLIWYSVFLVWVSDIFSVLKTVYFLVFNRSLTFHTLQYEYNELIMKTKSENGPAMDSTYMEDKYHTPSHCRHCENIIFVSLSLSSY